MMLLADAGPSLNITQLGVAGAIVALLLWFIGMLAAGKLIWVREKDDAVRILNGDLERERAEKATVQTKLDEIRDFLAKETNTLLAQSVQAVTHYNELFRPFMEKQMDDQRKKIGEGR